MAKFYIREDLLNLLGEDFYQYYRRNRKHRDEKLNTCVKVNAAVSKLFSEMHRMLQECKHGVSLKNFGIIAPKEFIYEDKNSIFKVKYIKKGGYLVILEDEYLQSQYKSLLLSKGPQNNEEKVTEIKKPRPYAVIMHRKNLRKNKLKDAED